MFPCLLKCALRFEVRRKYSMAQVERARKLLGIAIMDAGHAANNVPEVAGAS